MRDARATNLFWIGLLTLAGAAAGCGGGGRPPAATGEGEWEVTVIAGGDTTAVPVGTKSPPSVARVVGVDPDAEEGEWEVTVEGGVLADSAAAADSVPTVPAPGAKPLPPRGDLALSPPPDRPAGPARAADYTYGFRLQILASSSMLLAEQEAARADSLFALPVYIEYEPPFYKVRLGDFVVREDAAHALEETVRPRYERAWLAETMVRRPGR